VSALGLVWCAGSAVTVLGGGVAPTAVDSRLDLTPQQWEQDTTRRLHVCGGPAEERPRH